MLVSFAETHSPIAEKPFNDVEKDVLKQVFWGKNVSQSIISERTHIPQQTVSRAVKSLTSKGALRTSEIKVAGARGKPGLELQVVPEFAYSLGLGVLPFGMEITLLDFSGQILRSEFIGMDMKDPQHSAHQLNQLLPDFIRQYLSHPNQLLGIGVGISGYFIEHKRELNTFKTLDAWAEVDIADLFRKATGLTVWVENDATAAAAGEGMSGVGRGNSDFVFLFISEGFGGGVISNSQVVRGVNGNAGELGDMLPHKVYLHPNLELLRLELARHGHRMAPDCNWQTEFDIRWEGVDDWLFKIKDSLNMVTTCCSALLDIHDIVIGGHIPQPLAKKLAAQTQVYVQSRRQDKRAKPDIIVSGIQHQPVATGAASLPIRELCL